MKLSELDRENIEVLEALDIDEDGLFNLLCRYFAYRSGRGNTAIGHVGFSPNRALQETIRFTVADSSIMAKKRGKA